MAEPRKDEIVDLWGPLRYFLGSWRGYGSGRIGESTVERSYALALNEQFIRVVDRAVYPPQEKNPQGEVHSEIGLLGFDRDREQHILREFHVEGFVIQYVLANSDDDAGVYVFVSESTENMPPGWRARTTYEILDEDQFSEVFELAAPGEAWARFVTIVFSRVKEPLPTESSNELSEQAPAA